MLRLTLFRGRVTSLVSGVSHAHKHDCHSKQLALQDYRDALARGEVRKLWWAASIMRKWRVKCILLRRIQSTCFFDLFNSIVNAGHEHPIKLLHQDNLGALLSEIDHIVPTTLL